jgi:hypothetical protein
MRRIAHGETLPLEPGTHLTDNVALSADDPATNQAEPIWRFGYMFEELQKDPLNLLPESKETVENLRKLSDEESMKDPGTKKVPGVLVPTAYTFLGQFIDHDITMEAGSKEIRDIAKEDLKPIPFEKVKKELVNYRSPNLELDSVYGFKEAVAKPDIPLDLHKKKFLLGEVSQPETLPLGKDAYNDLPRIKSEDPKSNRVARIGDPRNDENLILAQLHVAFLRAHNALVDRINCKFNEARELIIQHYQWIVLEDFLPRVADPAIVKSVRQEGPKFFDKTKEDFFMPLEFAGAAYRFGHSKVRNTYMEFNKKVGPAGLDMLFRFTQFSGTFGALTEHQINGMWVIDWTSFLRLDDEDFLSRPIDTTLSETLLNLMLEDGKPLSGVKRNLAIRNLFRGYLLSLPTGQAVARAVSAKSPEIKPMTDYEIASVAASKAQLKALVEGKFLERTPLWFYILAEAAYDNGGHRLGPVGSTIVAEVLIGILRYSDFSILSDPSWKPTLGPVPHKFDLSDLLTLANTL